MAMFAPSAVATTSRNAKAAERSKASSGKRLWPERFIEKYFMAMPSWVRVAVYLLMVVTYMHNVLQDAPLVGQLWIRQADGTEVQGANYLVRTPPTEFRTNADGYWMLPGPRRLPVGSVEAQLVSGEQLLARAAFCLPIPILAPLLGGQRYRMTFDPKTKQLTVAATLACASLGTRAEASGGAAAVPDRPGSIAIGIKRITLRNTGHLDSPAEVYFRTYFDGKELQPFGLPTREQKNNSLLLLDNRPAAPAGLSLTIPGPGQLRIELWGRNRSVKSYFRDADDRLAAFQLTVRNRETGSRVLKDGGVELEVDLR